MVTIELQVAEFPFASVAVSLTVFAPRFAQVKAVGLEVIVTIPQASVDPLFTWLWVIEAVPVPLSCTVRFWQIIVGRMVSLIVIIPAQVAVFPELSVTVRITGLAPTLAQLNVGTFKVKDNIPQLSVEPEFIMDPGGVTVPPMFR